MKGLDNRFSIELGTETIFLRLSSQFSQASHQWQSLRHCNSEYELHILLAGSCQLEVETQNLSLEKGNAVLIAPGQYHYPQVSSEPFQRFSVSFLTSEGIFADALRQTVPVYRIYKTSPEQQTHCQTIYQEYGTTSPYRNEMLQAQLTEFLISQFRSLNLTKQETEHHPAAVERAREDLMDQFFADHFHENGCAPLLAELLHLSRRQTARVVEQQYGMSFQKKLMNTRMDRASWLLRTTQMRISEIAEAIGYSSEAAFYEAFRSWFHMTPQQYRKQF